MALKAAQRDVDLDLSYVNPTKNPVGGRALLILPNRIALRARGVRTQGSRRTRAANYRVNLLDMNWLAEENAFRRRKLFDSLTVRRQDPSGEPSIEEFDYLIWYKLSAPDEGQWYLRTRDTGSGRPLHFEATSNRRDNWSRRLATIEKHLNANTVASSRPRSKSWITSNYTSSGTGFYISGAGHLLTNEHVIRGCRNVAVQPFADTRAEAVIIASDRNSDLALIKSTVQPTRVATIRKGRPIRTGNDVITFGFPLTSWLSSAGNLTKGSVTALSGIDNNASLLQISAPVQPGNSGGPLFDRSGNVVGVVVAKLSALKVAKYTGDIPQNVNFAIKWRVVEDFLDVSDVRYKTAPSKRRMDAADIADMAKKFTVKVLCWN